MLARGAGRAPDVRRWWLGGAVLGLLIATPLVVSGPGNDLDVANVFRSGRSIAFHLSYVPSRPPGAPVFEAIVGVLDLIGGPLLTNLGTLAAAVALLVALDRLLVREGVRAGGRLAVALVAANPWFVVAATSTADYVFALAFVVLAAHALRSNRPVLAGLAAAAAMGCRIGSAALVAALLLAELTESRTEPATEPDVAAATNDTTATTPTSIGTAQAEEHGGIEPGHVEHAGSAAAPGHAWLADHRAIIGSLAITSTVAIVATFLLFVPAFLAAGGISFAENDFSTSSPLVQLGRAAVKDLTLLGPLGSLVALLALPALWAALRRWRTTWLVRFALVGFVLSQVLFIRFPWKMPHLLPSLLCLAILLGVALDRKPRILAALVALQLLFCVVGLSLVRPNDPNAATGGRIDPHVGWGPVVVDWQCRREHTDAYLGRQKIEVEAAWDCAKPFGS